jgi:tetratricopeptide (TPR) repeat protein
VSQTGDGDVRSKISGRAGDVVQARDVSGGVHFHQRISVIPRPSQLPGQHAAFVDRLEAIALLDAALAGRGHRRAVIVGMPGAGKTTLAVHWAYRNLPSYPDGQLYANLHGYDSTQPVSPLRALRGFLLALGVRRDELAADVDEAAAQFRSAVAGRQLLIILDNARRADQVRPLLPGEGQCAVLVTSREQMSGLVARDGARRVPLGPLREHDAIDLLASLIQEERPADSAAALGELAVLCARLPLALRIAAEHALSRPLVSIRDLVADLRRQSALWRALTVDDHAQWDEPVLAHSVFAWSYQALPETAARVFRSLSLHPGPDLSEAAAVALAGQTASRQSLDILVGAHLLERPAGDRYQFHDLVRSYAVDQAREEDPPERRHDATRRLLLWYLRSADAAQPHVNPKEARVPIGPIRGDEPRPKAFGSYEEAVEWFDREHGNLLASVTVAGEQGLHEIAWKLAVVLRAFHMRFSMVEEWLTASGAGLRSAEAIGDLAAQGELLESMGMAHSQAYNLDRSEEYLTRALQVRRQVRDQHSLALTLNSLGMLHVRRHYLIAARSVFQEALDIYAELEDETWVPVIRANLAEALIGLGHSPAAETLILDALADLRRRGDTGSQGNALRLLSMARRDQGDLDRARSAAEDAVTLAVQQRHLGREGYWLLELGTVQRLSGELAAARDSFSRAADLLHGAGQKMREAQAWDLQGTVQYEMGNLDNAIESHRNAAEAFRSLAARWPLAVALHNLAIALIASGDPATARVTAAEATSLLTEFNDPTARTMRESLRQLSLDP